MSLRKSLPGIMGIILGCGIVTFAQEPQTPSANEPVRKEMNERMERQRERVERREGRRGPDGMGRRRFGQGHLMSKLNLTDEQRQQARAIMQRRLQGTRAQREELFKLREKRIDGTFTADDEASAKILRQEIRTAMEGVRTEMAGVLTAEQKAKLEELKKQHKERMEQRMKERQERLNQNPASDLYLFNERLGVFRHARPFRFENCESGGSPIREGSQHKLMWSPSLRSGFCLSSDRNRLGRSTNTAQIAGLQIVFQHDKRFPFVAVRILHPDLVLNRVAAVGLHLVPGDESGIRPLLTHRQHIVC